MRLALPFFLFLFSCSSQVQPDAPQKSPLPPPPDKSPLMPPKEPVEDTLPADSSPPDNPFREPSSSFELPNDLQLAEGEERVESAPNAPTLIATPAS